MGAPGLACMTGMGDVDQHATSMDDSTAFLHAPDGQRMWRAPVDDHHVNVGHIDCGMLAHCKWLEHNIR